MVVRLTIIRLSALERGQVQQVLEHIGLSSALI